MMELFDKLNLRPNERRLVVVVGLFLFVLLNLWLVKPHYHDWALVQDNLRKAHLNLAKYQAEVSKTNHFLETLDSLKSEGGKVPSAQRDTDLGRIIQRQAAQHVVIRDQSPINLPASGSATNFFEEKAQRVDLEPAPPQDLLEFLHGLGTNESMIRVKGMVLDPDPSGMKLKASVTLVATYQRVPSKTNTSSAAVVAGARLPVVPTGSIRPTNSDRGARGLPLLPTNRPPAGIHAMPTNLNPVRPVPPDARLRGAAGRTNAPGIKPPKP